MRLPIFVVFVWACVLAAIGCTQLDGMQLQPVIVPVHRYFSPVGLAMGRFVATPQLVTSKKRNSRICREYGFELCSKVFSVQSGLRP
jgi:hypothetical protein